MNFTVLSTLDYLKNYSGASSIAVAVVLVWKDEKRIEKPLAFVSRQLEAKN